MHDIPGTYRGKTLTHAWTYRAADGSPMGKVGRYDGPDGRKDVVPFFKLNGSGWLPGGPGEPRPLFGLDVLAADPGAPVLVVEGERCAAALQSLGLVAVTAQGGSAAAHLADWGPLDGRGRAFLLPDNDTPGLAYAEAVAGALRDLDAPPEVRLVDLLELPEAGDVVDWIRARCPGWDGFAPVPEGERERLVAELRETAKKGRPVPPEWIPEPETPAPLVPLSSFELPPLRLALLPGALGAFAEALARHTETPPELAAAMALAATSATIQKRYRVMVRAGYFEPLNLYLLAALPPGNRKSAVVEAAIAPLLDWETAEAERLAPEIRRAAQERKVAEARAETLRKQAAKAKSAAERARHMGDLEAVLDDMPPELRAPQLVTTDATPERLGVLLADNGERMAWLSSEGGVFDMLAGRYSGGIPNLDLILKAHSGDFERVDRGNRPTAYLRHPALTVGLSPQPEVLRGLIQKPGFRGRGLLGRFLYLLPESPLGFRKLTGAPIPEAVSGAYADTLGAILDKAHQEPRIVKLAPAALAEWRDFALDVETRLRPGGEFEHVTDWAGKLPGAAARLAGVLHVATHAHANPEAELVAPETMDAALELAAVLSRHALAAFDLMGADSDIEAARQVWGWVEHGRRERFSTQECWQGFKGRFARMAELSEALAVLIERGYLIETRPPRKGPGRPPAPVYVVRGDIARGWA